MLYQKVDQNVQRVREYILVFIFQAGLVTSPRNVVGFFMCSFTLHSMRGKKKGKRLIKIAHLYSDFFSGQQ